MGEASEDLMEVGVLTQLPSRIPVKRHSEVRVSWLESLAGVFVAPKVGCVGTILSMHLPVGFPDRLSSLKTWSFCSFSSQLSHVSWARSFLVASLLSFMQ